MSRELSVCAVHAREDEAGGAAGLGVRGHGAQFSSGVGPGGHCVPGHWWDMHVVPPVSWGNHGLGDILLLVLSLPF